MPQASDVTPPFDNVEIGPISFDFGPYLAPDVTIIDTSSSLVTISVVGGIDASASSRLIGGSTITSSLETGAAAAQVDQTFGDFPADEVRYLVVCTVNTSDDRTLAIWSHFDTVVPA